MFIRKTGAVFAVAATTFALAAPGYAQTTVSSTEAGFSYTLPAGWTARKVPPSEYTVAFAPRVDDFTSI